MNRRRFLGYVALGIGALAGGRLPNVPSVPAPPVTWHLFPEGTFLIDGGTLELGIVRDSVSSYAGNDFKMFAETFENVARIPNVSVVSAASER